MATKSMRSDQPEVNSARGLRSPSSSSDVMSASGRSMAAGIPVVTPPPLFVAQSAAEGPTSTELDRLVSVTEPSLELVNGFLDQTLYNILALSKGTSLSAVRIAVPKLLKPRLGQAALNAADEEVRDILDMTDYNQTQSASIKIKPSDFDLELVWKLARLRCMVYSRLGDLEEEDEEELLEREGLSEHAQNPKLASTPIEALFLAAILGFLGEQALCIAAQHAEARHDHQVANTARDEDSEGEQEEDDIVLDAADLLQLGREGPLSRIWRSWRRDTRTAEPVSSRPGSRSTAIATPVGEGSHARKRSMNAPNESIPEEHTPKSASPSQIPLPMRANDVDEIEVPGLAPPLDGEAEDDVQIPERSARRPSSVLILPNDDRLQRETEDGVDAEGGPLRPQPQRNRSQSLPNNARRPSVMVQSAQVRGTAPNASGGVQSLDTTKQTEKEEVFQETQTKRDKEASDTDKPRRVSNARSSIINGTVAALAGALGIEAMKSSRLSKDQQEQSFKSAEKSEQPKRSRTVAEEILGPTTYVPPPTDAETGSSITGPSDFDSMHIPLSANEECGPSGQREEGGSSDPEDLALSSGDDDTQLAKRQPNRKSAYVVPVPLQRQSDELQRRAAAASPPSSPSSPKRVKREAAIYENAMIEPVDDGVGQQDSAPTGPNYSEHGAPIRQPVQQSTATYPERGSSREPNNSHVAAVSQYSRTSGSSGSGKVFVHGRDQRSRSSTLNEQRAAFSEHSQEGHSRKVSQEHSRGSPRDRLRLNTDEDSKIAEDKKKSLEILIRSDETLHYTLTPESARRAEFAPADIRPKTETQDLADFIRNTAPPGDEPARPSTARQVVNGLRSNPTQAAAAAAGRPSAQESGSGAALPSPRSQQRFGEPRDARPERNTTRDLADYVRSTGPTNEHQLAQALGTRPSTARQQSGGLRADGVPVAPVSGQSMDSTRPTTAGDQPVNRLKFQARDARPIRNTETAELIDFIREGPPRAAGDHRIARTVAPFRTTMDSDDFNALAPPPEVAGRGSVGSAPESAVTAKSVQESTNSRTALLESTNRANARPTNGVIAAPAGGSRPVKAEQNGMPPRTRRAARDPYEISDDDDELFEEIVEKPKPKSQEESLIDFLRNTAPPPGMAPQPIMASAPPAETNGGLKRAVSNSRLKDVLIRSVSSANRSNATSKPANGAREESPHLTQIGSKYDKYRPTQTTHAAHVDRNRQRLRGEARDQPNSDSGTADLAHYLKNSGPAEAPRQQQHSPTKDQAGFLKFFSKRGSVKR